MLDVAALYAGVPEDVRALAFAMYSQHTGERSNDTTLCMAFAQRGSASVLSELSWKMRRYERGEGGAGVT